MAKYTWTTEWWGPALGLPQTMFGFGLKNIYLEIEGLITEHKPYQVYAHFNLTGHGEIVKETVESIVKNLPNKVEIEYVTDDQFILVLSIPENYQQDFDFYSQGKYSKMSKDFANTHLVKVLGITSMKQLYPYSVIMKTEHRKKMLEEKIGEALPENAEYMSLLNLEREKTSLVEIVSLNPENVI